MKPRIAVITAAVLIPLAIVAAAFALRADGSDKTRIPVALSSSTTTPEGVGAAADIARYPYGSTYEAGPDLPALGGSAVAYKLDGVATDADMQRLQNALGMNGTVLDEDNAFTAVDGDHSLSLESTGALGWSYSSNNGVVSSGVATACASDVPDCVPDTTIPNRPADLPSEDAARTRALDVLRALGTDVDHASVVVDDGITSWIVRVDPVIDGVTVENLASTVTVGAGGAIEYANGFLATPTKVDSYPLVTTSVAIDRLNQGIGLPGPRPLLGVPAVATDDVAVTDDTPQTTVTIEPSESPSSGSVSGGAPGSTGGGETTPAAPPIEEPPLPTVTIEPSPPDTLPSQVVVLTGVDRVVVLTTSQDGRTAWLLPAYRFSSESSMGATVLAVADAYLSPGN